MYKILAILFVFFATSSFSDITEIIPGELYVAESTNEDGKPVYFGYEKVDEDNLPFFNKYCHLSLEVARESQSIVAYSLSNEPEIARRHAIKLGLTNQNFDSLKTHIAQNIKTFENLLLNGLDTEKFEIGNIGMRKNLIMSRPDFDTYFVYASTNPITQKHNDIDTSNAHIGNFKDLYGHIIISFIATAPKNVPVVTHFGIFTNPIIHLNTTQQYPRMSLKLHGFSAAVNQQFFPIKKYMITWPNATMLKIIINAIEGAGLQKFLHVGIYDRMVRPSAREYDLREKFPPLIHKGGGFDCLTIAKAGVNLDNYPYELPDEEIFYSELMGPKFNYTTPTRSGHMILVDLVGLKEFIK